MALEIPRRQLGRTGEAVSVIGLGGFHLGLLPSRDDAIRFIRAAIDRGINFIDNSWDYHGGESERRVGLALRGGYRERAFVMSKIDGRSREKARRQIDESLRRQGLEQIDLMQLHEIIHRDDPERVHAPGGALEALEEARTAGKIRFVGFTGHKSPALLLRMLAENYAWDAVQMPLNVLDPGFDSFQRQALPVLLKRRVGVLGMKPLAAGEVLKTGAVSAVEALRYAMSLGAAVVITGMQSWADLNQAFEAAASFSSPGGREIERLLARVAAAAPPGVYEEYKTTTKHDGTSEHPEWL